MEIRNEIKGKEEKKQFVQRSLADIQRAKLAKLMDNPDKPVVIPENHRKDKEYAAPSFIRNVMGSSAGAGSGEFHVYRHLRRKEYARQKNMKAQTEQERLDTEYQDKLEQNQRIAEERTSKKRQKRQKKKKNQKNKDKKPKLQSDNNAEEDDDDDDDEDKSESGEKSSNEDTPSEQPEQQQNAVEEKSEDVEKQQEEKFGET